MPIDTGTKAGMKRAARSAVTNGSRLLADVDGRSQWARRFRDLVALHLSDLGGADKVSEAQRQIVRRCATLSVECERLETQFAQAGEADPAALDLYQRTANSLRRLLLTLGLNLESQQQVPECIVILPPQNESP